MAFYHSAGELFNLFARGTLSCSPAESVAFPLAGFSDDNPKPFRFGSLAADSYVQLRNNLLTNPSFELALGAEWVQASTGTGTAAAGAAGSGRAGGATIALRCNGGAAGVGQRYQPKAVRAGERLRIDFWCKPGAGKTGSVRIYNPTTGKWLVGGVWQAAAGDAVTVTDNAAWTRCAVTTFTVESMALCCWPTVTLWVYCRTIENANVDFDDVALIPAVNGVVIHGHNWRPCLSPTLRYSDDAFSADDTLAAALTIARPSFYAYLDTAIYREWWRVKLGGTNTVIPWAAEGWLGYFEELSASANDGWEVARVSVVEGETVGGLSRVRTADERPRRLKMDFSRISEAEWREVLDDIDGRTYGGGESLVCVPESTSTEARVICGKIDPGSLALVRESPAVWKIAGVTITEMAVLRMLS